MVAKSKSIDWSEFEAKRFAFETVGDKGSGTVTGVRIENGQSGRTPVLEVKDTDDRARELWCGSFDLKQKFAELRPEVGDGIYVELVELRHTGMPSPMKVFDVRVTKPDDEAF
jgi:hypothetical protein